MKQKIVEREKTLSRREFGKIAAGLGMASLPGFSKALVAEDSMQENRKLYNIKEIDGVMQWKIDRSKFKRFKATNYAFNTLPNKLGQPWYYGYGAQRVKNLKSGKYHKDIPAPSVADARSALSLSMAANTIRDMSPMIENTGFFTVNPYNTKKFLRTEPDEKDPKKLTVQAKLAARLFGADLVGIAPLNRDFVYSNYTKARNKPHDETKVRNIVFKDVKEGYETDTELVIPDSINNVIVVAYEQNREMIQTSPSTMAGSADNWGYTRQTVCDLSLAEFIRGLGYEAIPCSNTMALTVPLAVEAGLGEAGRNGLLVTPEFGPNVRVTKVLTNMPLVHDKPIEFGVQEFCESCKKCARECPSKTITEGPKSWEPRSICNQTGLFKWQNDMEKCLEYWIESGQSCINCVAVCPYTKGAIWVHELVKSTIDNVRWMDPVMLGLDDAFGYAKRRNENDVWNMSIGTYGLDYKHFKNSVEKGKFPL